MAQVSVPLHLDDGIRLKIAARTDPANHPVIAHAPAGGNDYEARFDLPNGQMATLSDHRQFSNGSEALAYYQKLNQTVSKALGTAPPTSALVYQGGEAQASTGGHASAALGGHAVALDDGDAVASGPNTSALAEGPHSRANANVTLADGCPAQESFRPGAMANASSGGYAAATSTHCGATHAVADGGESEAYAAADGPLNTATSNALDGGVATAAAGYGPGGTASSNAEGTATVSKVWAANGANVTGAADYGSKLAVAGSNPNTVLNQQLHDGSTRNVQGQAR